MRQARWWRPLLLTLAFAAMTPWSQPSGAAGQEEQSPAQFRVSSGTVTVLCRLTLGGSFTAVSTRLDGELGIASDAAAPLAGALQIALDTLDTGIGLRNTHMRENYLETSKGPEFAHATLEQIRLLRPDVVQSGGRTPFEGRLTVHGTRRDVQGEVRLTRQPGRVRIDATFPISLSSYGIPEPRYLGIGVRDAVEVRVDATFASVEAPR